LEIFQTSPSLNHLEVASRLGAPEQNPTEEMTCVATTITELLATAVHQTWWKMSVLIETSAGEIVIDLYATDCPLTVKNFLKLCKIKYYHGCLFYNVQENFIAQTGDPSGTGTGGSSVYGLVYGPQAISFEDEIKKHRKHNKVGIVSMAGGENGNRSQFFFTLRDEDLEQLDGKHTVFGEVAEGLETLQKINCLYVDETGRPFQDVRIRHTHILDDPFDDPPQLDIPPSSPVHEYPPEERVNRRIRYEDGIADADEETRTAAELEESIRRKEAESRAIVLEMTGDIPDAEVCSHD
jgi:peptidyl-prolyl cis-trans isomerase-like 4